MDTMSTQGKTETEPASNFNLTSTTSPLFSNRSNDIFGSLEVLEQKHLAYQKTQASSKSLEEAGVMKSDPVEEEEKLKGSGGRRHDTNRGEKRDRHHQSHRSWRPSSDRNYDNDNKRRHGSFPKDDFRRPNIPLRAKRVPDFKKHPAKWTSYSLDDVSERDLSEKSNTRAALDFLFERKNERERMERIAAGLPEEEEKFESGNAACSKGLISFSRPRQSGEKRGGNADKSDKSSLDCDKFCESFDGDKGMNAGVDVQPTEEMDFSDCTGDTDSVTMSHRSGDNRKVSRDLSKRDTIEDDEEKKTESDTVFKFKSRKNVRKQIRKKDDDDDGGD